MKVYQPGDIKHGCEVHFCVDLDGTLAKYEKGDYPSPPGPPISIMVEKVKQWLAMGWKVKIFTARAWLPRYPSLEQKEKQLQQIAMISDWCREHVGKVLEITCQKDPGTLEIWDDRAVSVEFNTGNFVAAGDVNQ